RRRDRCALGPLPAEADRRGRPEELPAGVVMRVFVALRPSPAALEHLDVALEHVRARAGLALRWGDAEHRHRALAFRADRRAGALEGAGEHLASHAAGHPPMSRQLGGAGVFAARSLWIGVGGDTGQRAALMGEERLEGELR